jgi:catechol 2,3-dioxygenase-like lactoylglutathione lyase family enzyme
MLGDGALIAFTATADADRAVRFYRDELGLALLEQTPFACVFQTPGAQLRVTIVESVQPAPYSILGWEVSDIQGAAAQLRARGIPPLRYEALGQAELGIWHSPSGARVLWFQDPDGHVLSLTQVNRPAAAPPGRAPARSAA